MQLFGAKANYALQQQIHFEANIYLELIQCYFVSNRYIYLVQSDAFYSVIVDHGVDAFVVPLKLIIFVAAKGNYLCTISCSTKSEFETPLWTFVVESCDE